jgi:transcription factor TFIIIB component B''
MRTGSEVANDQGSTADEVQVKKASRRRSLTPDDAEKLEVDIRQVKMGDLIKDLRIGKKFSRHDELLERERSKRQKTYQVRKLKEAGLDVDEEEVAQARDEQPAATAAIGTKARAAGESSSGVSAAPQFQIVDGQIVLNSGSLQYDRHARAAEEAGTLEEEIEDDFTHHTTSASYMRRPLRGNTWTDDETERFYHGLRMFGTEFQLISNMFPGKTRRHVKLKFNREERLRPRRVNAALVGEKTVAMDLDEYRGHTGREYQTVDAITAELRAAEEEFEAEQRRHDEEAAEEARRKREELFGDPATRHQSADPQKDDNEPAADDGLAADDSSRPKRTRSRAKPKPSTSRAA